MIGSPTDRPVLADLAGRSVLITGASRGIGAATARAMARAGARVALAARDQEACRKTADAIGRDGGTAVAVPLDLAARESVADGVARAADAFGGLDTVVHNGATIEPIGRLAALDRAGFEQAVAVNLTGSVDLIQAVLPPLREADRPTFLSVSTGAAHRALEGWAAYCSTKAALRLVVEALAEEEGGWLRVIGFRPGVVDTDMQGRIRASGINPVSRIRREDLAPPDRPAVVIAWLCTREGHRFRGSEVDIADPELINDPSLSRLLG